MTRTDDNGDKLIEDQMQNPQSETTSKNIIHIPVTPPTTSSQLING